MARENQGPLIAIIVLALVMLLFAVTSFFAISKMMENGDARAAAEENLAAEKAYSSAYKAQVDIMKAYIGDFGPSVAEVQTSFDALDRVKNGLSEDKRGAIDTIIADARLVRTEYDKDMKQFIAGEGDQAQEFTWRSLNRNLASVLSKKHVENNVQRGDIERITLEATAEVAAKDASLTAAKKSLQEARDALRTEQERWAAKEDTLNKTLEKVRTENENTIALSSNREKDMIRKRQALDGKLSGVTKERDLLKERVNVYERQVFDVPDGKIVRVSPANDLVYLNLGRDDGLRRNMTFSVFNETVTNFKDGENKAMVEVTRILGPNQAEARITDEDPAFPISRGDLVMTATWDPGQRVPIALVGMFDLDGDGISDRERLVQMIEKNGGDVVCQHTEDGAILGEVNAATRYLVLGNSPEVSADTNPRVFSAIETIMEQSKTNSVEEISVPKLFNWMGTHGRAKIERLDSRLGEGFRRRNPVDRLKTRDEREEQQRRINGDRN